MQHACFLMFLVCESIALSMRVLLQADKVYGVSHRNRISQCVIHLLCQTCSLFVEVAASLKAMLCPMAHFTPS